MKWYNENIVVAVGNHYKKQVKDLIIMISNFATSNLYSPLSQQEVALAKAHRIAMKVNEQFARMMTSKCETERQEASASHREALTLMRENSHLFTEDYWFAKSGIERLTETSEELRARLNNNFGMPSYGLPRQGFSLNSATNSMTIGVGSRISMGHYSLHVLDFTVGAFTNDWRDPKDGLTHLGNTNSAYTRALDWLLRASSSGNAKMPDRELNQDTLSLLNKIGIDTSRNFHINGTEFEVKNGVLQTVGFAHEQPTRSVLGIEGLNQLVERAYAQNLFAF